MVLEAVAVLASHPLPGQQAPDIARYGSDADPGSQCDSNADSDVAQLRQVAQVAQIAHNALAENHWTQLSPHTPQPRAQRSH